MSGRHLNHWLTFTGALLHRQRRWKRCCALAHLMILEKREPHSFGNASFYSAVLEKRVVVDKDCSCPRLAWIVCQNYPCRSRPAANGWKGKMNYWASRQAAIRWNSTATLRGIHIAQYRGWGSIS